MKNLMKLPILTGALMAALAAPTIASAEQKVAILLPETFNPRWELQDAAGYIARMAEIAPDVEVMKFNANDDDNTMLIQAEQAMEAGAEVLVVIARDGEAQAIIAEKAHDLGVPVISYDRMIHSEYVDFWIQSDLVATGRAQAQHVVDNTESGDTIVIIKGSPLNIEAHAMSQGQHEVLDPLFDSGERILGYEEWTMGWDPTIARTNMDQALADLGNDIDGVVAMNDGTASAAVAALEAVSLGDAGIPISGLDGTVQALQLILLEKQTQTVWRPFHEMSAIAADITKILLEGGDTSSMASTTVSNNVSDDIPFVGVPFYDIVGVEGVQYIIDNDPTISKEDVCLGDAAATAFCEE